MAATIAADADSAIVRIVWKDYREETYVRTYVVDGAMSDADIALMIDDLDACSNAGIIECTVTRQFLVTGLSDTPSTSAQNLVAAIIGLNFTKANPLNAAKTVRKGVIIPAYVDALLGDDQMLDLSGDPVTPSTALDHLRSLIEYLKDNLQYEAVDGDFYPGGWTFDSSQSGAGTLESRTDGL